MDQYMKELKEIIKPELESEVVYLNDRQEAFDKINKAYQALAGKDVQLLISKIEYRMGSLVNAHKFSTVANQEDVEKDTAELNQLVSDLNNEILDIENIGLEMGSTYEEPKYQDFAGRITEIINKTLESCNEVVRKATDVLGHKFDSADVVVDKIDTKVEDEIEKEEITTTEIKTDSIEEIEKDLNKELQPIQEDKKELEEAKNDLNEGVKVTSIEPAPEAIAPVLIPESNPDLDSFLNKGPQQEEKAESPVVESPVNDIKSADNVDEGPVLVTKVETFDLSEEKEQEGPVLSRTA